MSSSKCSMYALPLSRERQMLSFSNFLSLLWSNPVFVLAYLAALLKLRRRKAKGNNFIPLPFKVKCETCPLWFVRIPDTSQDMSSQYKDPEQDQHIYQCRRNNEISMMFKHVYIFRKAILFSNESKLSSTFRFTLSLLWQNKIQNKHPY